MKKSSFAVGDTIQSMINPKVRWRVIDRTYSYYKLEYVGISSIPISNSTYSRTDIDDGSWRVLSKLEKAMK